MGPFSQNSKIYITVRFYIKVVYEQFILWNLLAKMIKYVYYSDDSLSCHDQYIPGNALDKIIKYVYYSIAYSHRWMY